MTESTTTVRAAAARRHAARLWATPLRRRGPRCALAPHSQPVHVVGSLPYRARLAVLVRVLFAGAPQELDVTVFPVDDETATAQVQAVAAEARRARDFTDMASFTIRCLVCQNGLKGESEAVEHAKSTGHTNFSEYR